MSLNTPTVVAAAVSAASLSLHVEPILYWIGPAGCIILIPALVVILALPLLESGSSLHRAKPQAAERIYEDPELLTAARGAAQDPYPATLPTDYHALPQPQVGLSERQLSGLKQLGQWIKSFLGPNSLSPARANNVDMLDKAEKIKITERIKPDGVRERSVMIFYRKA
jgi:hypothetical protein